MILHTANDSVAFQNLVRSGLSQEPRCIAEYVPASAGNDSLTWTMRRRLVRAEKAGEAVKIQIIVLMGALMITWVEEVSIQ